MQVQSLRSQLAYTQQSFEKLRESFQNNIRVIEELENENFTLRNQIKDMRYEQKKQIDEIIYDKRAQHHLQTEKIQNYYESKISELTCNYQQEMQKMSDMMTNKMHKEANRLQKIQEEQIKILKQEKNSCENSIKQLIQQNNKLIDNSKQLKQSVIFWQNKTHELTQDKQCYCEKLQLHQKEIESINNSNQQWQEALKYKISQIQKQKQKIQQQYSDFKLLSRDKLKKYKQEFSQKLIKITQQKDTELRQILNDTKQIKYNYDNIIKNNYELKQQKNNIKIQKDKINIELNKLQQKYKQQQPNKNKNQNQIKLLQKQINYLRQQIKMFYQVKNKMNDQIHDINQRRQNAQKSLERLKVQYMNKTKQNDEIVKQIKKLKRNIMNQNNNNAIQKYNVKDSIKDQIDYSKCFTQDMGPVDDRFLNQNSPRELSKAPTHLLKKIGQLQVECQQYRITIKTLKDQMQNTSKLVQDKLEIKDRQIRLYKEQSNILRQKANDKESIIMNLKQSHNELKNQLNELKKIHKNNETLQNEYNKLEKQKEQYEKKLKIFQKENKQRKEQIIAILQQNQTLEQLSSQLRVQINQLKIKLKLKYQNQNQSDQENYQVMQIQDQEQIENIKFNNQINNNDECPIIQQTVPRKLHDLIKEKKKFQVTGNKAHLVNKIVKPKIEQIGTLNKQIYQHKKQSIKKTGINYNKLKKQAEE